MHGRLCLGGWNLRQRLRPGVQLRNLRLRPPPLHAPAAASPAAASGRWHVRDRSRHGAVLPRYCEPVRRLTGASRVPDDVRIRNARIGVCRPVPMHDAWAERRGARAHWLRDSPQRLRPDLLPSRSGALRDRFARAVQPAGQVEALRSECRGWLCAHLLRWRAESARGTQTLPLRPLFSAPCFDWRYLCDTRSRHDNKEAAPGAGWHRLRG